MPIIARAASATTTATPENRAVGDQPASSRAPTMIGAKMPPKRPIPIPQPTPEVRSAEG